MQTLKTKLAVTVAAGVLAACPVANAALTVGASVGGVPDTAGATLVNFDNLTLGNSSQTVIPGVMSVNFSPDGQVVQGSSGQIAEPYLSSGQGAAFGTPDGPDKTKYLTSGAVPSTADATLTFTSPQNYLGLLWGSVDNYNTLTLLSGNTVVGTVLGSQVLTAAGINTSGAQDAAGTAYVNIHSTMGFNKVVATSSSYAFEFDNVAFSAVPEPSTYIAGALLLLPFGFSALRSVRRKQIA